MSSTEQTPRSQIGAPGRGVHWLRLIGPGLAVAATGVGAGDLLAAMLAGASFGATLLWVIVLGATLKLALNEGVARWQLATGTTLIDGWGDHLGRPFQVVFLVYLVGWSFIVAGGLMSACGVAAHALLPGLPIAAWGVLHSVAALVLVVVGRYRRFETLMKVLVAVMALTLLVSAVLVGPELAAVARGLLVPRLPRGSAATVLSLMGGVGGSVTILSYGYWIREKGWRGVRWLPTVRRDLVVGYLLTAVFGAAMLVLASAALSSDVGVPPGSQGLVACANAIERGAAARLGPVVGSTASAVFLIGLWAAVFTSTLGVWQGVPYLFADFVGRRSDTVDERSWLYRGYLLYLAVPPMSLLVLDRPVWVIKLYTLTGGLFMPILAASLVWLTTRQRFMGDERTRPLGLIAMTAALALFVIIAVRQIVDLVG